MHILMLLFFNFLVPSVNISLQPSGVDKTTVAQKQEVICSIPIPPNLDPDTVEFGWLNEEGIITNNSRVIFYERKTDNTLVTIMQFDPLIEEDEGVYICYAVMNGSLIYESTDLHEFTSKQTQTLMQCIS